MEYLILGLLIILYISVIFLFNKCVKLKRELRDLRNDVTGVKILVESKIYGLEKRIDDIIRLKE